MYGSLSLGLHIMAWGLKGGIFWRVSRQTGLDHVEDALWGSPNMQSALHNTSLALLGQIWADGTE